MFATLVIRWRRQAPLLLDVWRLSLPVILTNLLQTLVNVVDVFMVGRLGAEAVAAVGMSQVVRMLMLVGVLTITTGSMVLAAQARGARDPGRLSRVARQSLTFATMFGLALALVGWWLPEPVLRFLNSGDGGAVVSQGVVYLRILFLGATFLALNMIVNRLMQGAGDTITPLALTGGINAVNIVLDYVFIFGAGPVPAMGIAGAALGTVVARALGSAVGIGLLHSGRNVVHIREGGYLPEWPLLRDIVGIGVPSGVQGVARNMTQVFVVRILTSTSAGAFGAAALAIGTQVTSLVFMPGLAINLAATSLVGQALGAWQTEDARARGGLAIGLGVAVMSLLAIPVVVFAPQLVLFFEPSAQATVMQAGTSYLRIVGLSQPVLAIAMVANGSLRGAGDTMPGLYGTLLGRWVVAIPLAYLLALPLGLGPEGVWWALVAGTVVQAVYTLVRWRGGRWLGVALRTSAVYRSHLRRLPRTEQQRFLSEVRTPLMALEGVTEEVDEHGVRYRGGAVDVSVRFADHGAPLPRDDAGAAPSYLLQQRNGPAAGAGAGKAAR